jgi:hypothetical protein
MPTIKITAGAVSIEYDGEQDFIEDGLLELLDNVIEKSVSLPPSASSGPSPAKQATGGPELSTNTIAQLLNVRTGSDLALAAISRLQIVKGQPSAGRQEILDEMREAPSYFKDTYVSNLTAYFETLIKSRRVNLVARATYALAAQERKRIQGVIEAAVVDE